MQVFLYGVNYFSFTFRCKVLIDGTFGVKSVIIHFLYPIKKQLFRVFTIFYNSHCS